MVLVIILFLVFDMGLLEVFIGLILFLIVGNVVEYLIVVIVVFKNKMDFVIGVVVGLLI